MFSDLPIFTNFTTKKHLLISLVCSFFFLSFHFAFLMFEKFLFFLFFFSKNDVRITGPMTPSSESYEKQKQEMKSQEVNPTAPREG